MKILLKISNYSVKKPLNLQSQASWLLQVAEKTKPLDNQ